MRRMKKLGLSALAIVSLGIIGTSTTSAYNVLKSYRYDVNKLTGGVSNYHGHVYVNVPNSSVYQGSQRIHIHAGWNFNRYQQINHYSGYYNY